MKTQRTIEEINEKIERGEATVVTAEEMTEIVKSRGVEVAARDVDVVTTGTFGAMCSSGVFLNFGHSDPPIKIETLTLNGVEAYHGNAAVDAYLGATKMHPEKKFEYGGGHVIEDLVSGKEVELIATAYGTDCYPRRSVNTTITLEDLNQAILCNPRNAYQRYNAATNSRDELIYTYMGKLLPQYGNATYSGSGELNPLTNDPDYETIGVGTRIFLGGGIGYVTGPGTQHDPVTGFGTLMVQGDLKKMSPRFLRGGSFTNYGTTLYVGLGIPIPILNEGLAEKTGISDSEIKTSLLDYGVARRNRPILKNTDYAELKSGKITLRDRTIPVTALSSLKLAREVALTLKRWIQEKKFLLTSPQERLPCSGSLRPMKISRETLFAQNIMVPPVTCRADEDIDTVARRIVEKNVNHVVVVTSTGTLSGIVTSFDITRAVAMKETKLSNVMTQQVVTCSPDEPVESCARKMKKHDISALPVIDAQKNILGIVTSERISTLIGEYR
ncbi:MAG: homocysteine biosynthesis protein [Candidatus Bathyarchaeia archaeon]